MKESLYKDFLKKNLFMVSECTIKAIWEAAWLAACEACKVKIYTNITPCYCPFCSTKHPVCKGVVKAYNIDGESLFNKIEYCCSFCKLHFYIDR